MSYSFLNRYCTITANLPETGITTFTGWITDADKHALLIMDEYDNNHLVKREELVGDIVVLLEQKVMNLEIVTQY